MTNQERLINVFIAALGMSRENAEHAVFKVTKGWDSVGHINLMKVIEGEFDVSLEPDDILDFKSFAIGKEILGKYGISF